MKKQKVKREFSAGGVVFRREPEGILWLVIKPAGSEKWRLPKGWIGKNESSLEAAKREVAEEAGVKAEVLGKVGSEKYFFVQGKEKILKNVVFYLMEYLQEAETGFSWETEKIDWLPFKEAKERLAFAKEKEILEKAALKVCEAQTTC
ncbi:MAG: NUDIX hydrolase [Patescibacteria group bacterium]